MRRLRYVSRRAFELAVRVRVDTRERMPGEPDTEQLVKNTPSVRKVGLGKPGRMEISISPVEVFAVLWTRCHYRPGMNGGPGSVLSQATGHASVQLTA